MPIDEIRNKQKYVNPFADIWNWKYELATWYPVRGLIKFAYHTIRQIWKNMILVKPKIVGELFPQDMRRFAESEMEEVFADMFINLRQGVPGESKPPLEILQGDMKIKEWFDGFQSIIDFILIGCGFSPHNEAQVEQTATEIKSKNQTTTDTIRLMRQLRLDQYTRIHDKALIIHDLWDGKGKRPYTLSMPEDENLNKTLEHQDAQARIKADLSNYVDEISKKPILH